MRYLKISTVLTLTLLALQLAAVATASASAAFLPGSGTFTAKSSKATLQVKGGGAFKCATSTASGEIVGETTFQLILKLESCETGGLGINSVSPFKDAAKTILIEYAGTLCIVSLSPLTVGVILTLLPAAGVVLEWPSVKHQMTVRGAAIATLAPLNKSQTTASLSISQKEGKQGIEKCSEGGVKTLETSEDGGKTFIQSGEELVTPAEITFAKATELMG
jgi:hypothetical protein